MTRPIHWGILGTGSIAKEITRCLKGLPDADVVAVGSRSLSTADAFADEFGIPHRHASYAALANDPEIDIVYVATPHVLHADNTLLALRAGKHVLCEKPFTLNAGEAGQIIQEARERGLFLMEAMCTRFMPLVQEASRLIADGAIGKVMMVQGDFGMRPDFDADPRLRDLALGGGALLDIGLYPISLASFFLGPVVDVAATGVLGPTGVDEQTAVSMRHRDGGISVTYSTLHASTASEAMVMGTHGRILFHEFAYKSAALTLFSDGNAPRIIQMPFAGNGYQFELQHVMDCLRNGQTESSVMSLDESLAIMRVLDKVRSQIGLVYPSER